MLEWHRRHRRGFYSMKMLVGFRGLGGAGRFIGWAFYFINTYHDPFSGKILDGDM